MHVPDGWKLASLGDISQVTSGGTPDRGDPRCWENGTIPWVTTGEISVSEIKDTKEKITELGLKNSAAKIFPKGSILMAMYGQGKTRGQVARLVINASTNQACAAIILKSQYNSEFYFQFLLSKYKQLRSIGNEGTQKNLNGGLIKEILVPAPPLPEQQKIAQILSTWDKAIEKLNALIAAKQKRKKALMQQLLTGKKRFAGFEKPWKKEKLGDIFSKITNGLTYDTDAMTGLPVTRIETISTGKINYAKVGWAPTEENTIRFALQRGDILYSHINSLKHVGRVAIYCAEQPLYHGMNLLLLRANEKVVPEFIFHILNSKVGKKYAKSYAKSAVNQASISTTDVKSFKINIPEIKEQQKIASVFASADKEIETNQKQLFVLKQQKKGLMQQLLTGKKRVKIDESEQMTAVGA